MAPPERLVEDEGGQRHGRDRDDSREEGDGAGRDPRQPAVGQEVADHGRPQGVEQDGQPGAARDRPKIHRPRLDQGERQEEDEAEERDPGRDRQRRNARADPFAEDEEEGFADGRQQDQRVAEERVRPALEPAAGDLPGDRHRPDAADREPDPGQSLPPRPLPEQQERGEDDHRRGGAGDDPTLGGRGQPQPMEPTEGEAEDAERGLEEERRQVAAGETGSPARLPQQQRTEHERGETEPEGGGDRHRQLLDHPLAEHGRGADGGHRQRQFDVGEPGGRPRARSPPRSAPGYRRPASNSVHRPSAPVVHPDAPPTNDQNRGRRSGRKFGGALLDRRRRSARPARRG